MNKIKIFCVTNLELKYLEELKLNLVGVGNKKFNNNYISCLKGKNIQHKEKNYSELTFHYWFWKNELKNINKNTWIGFCQKRRFWLKSDQKINSFRKLKKNILERPPKKWLNYESIICNPIKIDNPKKMKLLKRGLINILKNPSIIFNKKKQNIKLHFDMHHGYGILDKAIDKLNAKERVLFRKFVNDNNSFNPHLMFISKKEVINKWFNSLFTWLFRCEKEFGLKNLKGYDQQRLYAYLAERYLSFWFKKNTKYLEWHWTFFEKKNLQ
tara:strand:- start:156 stop:962 length:807 start_codon:yes stop_codon:yes gene_type:complete